MSKDNSTLNIWTVYKNTLDHPNKFVARRFEADKPTSDNFVSSDLNSVRNWVKKEGRRFNQGGLTRLDRNPNDEPVILEVWL